MSALVNRTKNLCFFLLVLLITGCATVPKEVVELSYKTGEDIAVLYKSYDQLIQEYYKKMRDERISYIEEVWYPRFLKNWMQKGELTAIAKGEKIWSDLEEKLVSPTGIAKPEETFQTLNDWINYALYAREVKEDSLLSPLINEEKLLRRNVDIAFQNVMRANATITSHLNSLREVQEIQDDALKALKMDDLRNKITTTLSDVSEKANKELENIRKHDEKIKDLTVQIESFTNNK